MIMIVLLLDGVGMTMIIALGQKGIMMDDTISRQVAIDAFTHKWDGMVTSVFDVINSLPSAQPEIIRCGECTHKDKKIDYCHYLGITICERDYCSYGKRRTDEGDRC